MASNAVVVELLAIESPRDRSTTIDSSTPALSGQSLNWLPNSILDFGFFGFWMQGFWILD